MLFALIWQGLVSTTCAAAAQVQQALCDQGNYHGVPGIPDSISAEQLCSATQFASLDIYGAHVLNLVTTHQQNYTFAPPPVPGFPGGPYTNLDFCNVTITYTHPGWNDEINIIVLLPTKNWNGRFQATGGGGFVTGGGPLASLFLAPGLTDGFVVATTDGGHTAELSDAVDASSWALSSPGNVNWPLLVDFASAALHDMAEFGKAVTAAYYGMPPHYSYFHGASTGGRQGFMFAQMYPDDFDGIVAICPAINWVQFIVADYWPQFVMNQLGVYPRTCELTAITKAAIAACDELDGVEDGIISLPGLCDFDPHTLVGKTFDCAGETATFNSAAAAVADAAWSGPRSSTGEWQWFGVGRDADLGGIAMTSCDDDDDERGGSGSCQGSPFPIPTSWIRHFLKRDADFDVKTLTHDDWDELFYASVHQYQSVIGTSNPDLSAFRKRGGKMLSWHGLRDAVIPANGSVQYYDRVLQRDPAAHDYFRLVLVPGAGHALHEGPTPKNMMEAIVKWVEEGDVPETLRGVGPDGHGTVVERNLCVYPRVQVYQGGDPTVPGSFTCTE
ncbi:Tannase/feruloyl esterase [Aspergillus insuetus]